MDKIRAINHTLLVIGLVLAFTLISLFGLWNHYNTEMNSTETVNACPFVGQPCDMNMTEHIAMWQNFFTAPDISYLTFLLLLAIFMVSFLATPKIPKLTLKISEYIKYSFVNLFNYLTQAFSQGILNPKIY